ncbi:hypothetical protein R3P38DRAFT_3171879 [Favolaschia claudopus]|uniref:Uncharacterized protein n=1 Tax=Favolaschia claudopus TaxID=2862362 RepID=A0AAW0DRU6_9AGAR
MKDSSSTTIREARRSKSDPLAKTSSSRDAAQKTKSDILISIMPLYMNRIVERTKDHEFRGYLIPKAVSRMWLYVSSPEQTLKYIAVVSHGKCPGEIENQDGIGNADFNAGAGVACRAYAYEIRELYELLEPLPLKQMQSQYGVSFPQRYTYVLQRMIDDIVLEDQKRLF